MRSLGCRRTGSWTQPRIGRALTVFELAHEDGGIADASEYFQAGRVSGTTPFPAKNPFPVEIVPARLVAGRLPH